ncbi:metallophosphatase [Synechocystis sp. FACHB-383]|uniref:metallophosphatase n=1 Tax=Synechocystis sp. FACHB-383 TaxID=2692864 RepID=UPI00168252C4|nr:metallophosphatase [Synechocystis sp. FACHB-383]MBD2652366.1 metallophosphatase [Synechocystis sp. FACHB-383]
MINSYWAICSGIEGNLAAYEAVLADIKSQSDAITDFYILGDFVGLQGDNRAVIDRIQSPRADELIPQVCLGWWEEQCFNLHGLQGSLDAPELVAEVGTDGAKLLWESINWELVQWLRTLHFGFHELDCLLIHGSTVSYADELTPETAPITLCDRLIRADANNLFCGRSGLMFECWVEPQQLHSQVTTLDGPQPPQDQGKSPRRIVGVGNVGRKQGQSSYVLYNPATDKVKFNKVNYKPMTATRA